MKKIMLLGLCLFLLPVWINAEEVKKEEVKVFGVYSNKRSPDNHYIPSGWMGDYGDIKINDEFSANPHSGANCIQFVYSAKKSNNQGWAGVYWQNPANNWGAKSGGFDLSGMTKLTFWARGAKGGEVIDKVIVGGIKGVYPDSDEIGMGPIVLTKEWQQYTVNLAEKNLSFISGGFGWVMNADSNAEGAEFYLDDIKYEADASIKPEVKGAEKMPFYVYLDRGSVSNHYIPSGWMGDYGDIKLDVGSLEDPYMGNTCIKTAYSGKGAQGARWAGIYWQNPANNWGEKPGGYDLSNAAKLTFWARGGKGGERIEEFKTGGLFGEYSDSDTASIGPVILTKDWKEYTIDLKGKDFSSIIGGFCWATNVDVNPEGATFYLDEIRYE
ncbi:MAG: hypothetical protein AABY43_03380 [Candidatus Omnitrophota bacterium]